MKRSSVLIDTNVLLDLFLARNPYMDNAKKILQMCKDGVITGYIAAHSVSDLFYILRKDFTVTERRQLLVSLCKTVTVAAIDGEMILAALQNEDFNDFEDCLQYVCAREVNASYIITRNACDFDSSATPVVTPDEFCLMQIDNIGGIV